MNNNNNFNVNSWIGSTHQDFFKTSSNTLATQIINTSNIIENHLNASNIANSNYTTFSAISNSNYTYNTSNQITNYFNKLIDNQIEHISFPVSADLTHTYITNSNLGGEIRFYTKSSSLFPPVIPTDALPYRVKIKPDGKLYVYYTYDPSISLTNYTDWIDVGNTLVSILANNINTGLVITGLGAQLIFLTEKEEADIIGVYNAMVKLHEGDLIYEFTELMNYRQDVVNGLTEELTGNTLNDAFSGVRNFLNSGRISYLNQANQAIAIAINNNPYISFALGIGGVVFGIVYGLAQQTSFNNYLSSLYKDINSNINLSSTSKSNLIAYTSNTLIASNIIEMAVNYSNLTLAQGYINCNIQTQQFINNIKTNQITYNGYNIDNVFLSKQNGGFIYNNIGINAPTSGTPITGILGGGGDRLILQPAPNAIDYVCSVGIDLSSKNYWYSASSNFNYNWYIGGSNLMTLNSNTLNLSNVIIDASNIRQAGKELTSISSNIVLTSTPNVVKRYGFLCSVNNPIYPNGGNELFYKYDIYLPSYTITQNLPYTNDPYRIFEINVFIATCYFNTIINDLPDIINYKIYMSNKANAGSPFGDAGINLCATGFPINYKLDKIMANNIFLMRNNTNNFNYISIITRQIADVRVIITDLLN